MKTHAARWRDALWLSSLLFLQHCSIENLAGGNSSQTGNPGINGIVYNLDGSRAARAMVRAVPADFNPTDKGAVVIDSTVTNDTGGYSFDLLPSDIYNVFSYGATGLSYHDSVAIIKNAATGSLRDTLRQSGSIRGVVKLLPGQSSQDIIIIVKGTMTLGITDDPIGNFKLAHLARGTYNVRLLSTLPDYQPLDTHFTVHAGIDSELRDTIRMKYTGIPVPTGLRSTYDSLMQIVRLSWNKPLNGKTVRGFNVYRRNTDSNETETAINQRLVTDTTYRDSTGIQGRTYEYVIKAVDSQNTEGSKSAGVTVRIVAHLLRVTDSIINGEGKEPGQFSQISRGDIDSQGNIFIFDRGNERFQKLDSMGRRIFAITGFLNPLGFSFGPGNTFFLSYFSQKGAWAIGCYDSTGNERSEWTVQFKPRGMAFLSDTLYVIDDNGISEYDTSGNEMGCIVYPFDYTKEGGDIAFDSDGNIRLSDSRNVYRFDRGANSITTLYRITENSEYNQDPRITHICKTSILISTIGAKSPFKSSHYLIDASGNRIGRWHCTDPISDIVVKDKGGNRALAFTTNGKILSLICTSPAR